MTAASRDRFAQVVRSEPVEVGLACLLIGCEVEPDLDVDGSLAELDALAGTARPLVRAHGSLRGLQQALGAYQGSASDYDDVRSSLLHEVLRRKRGLPVLLSVLWCELADRLDLTAVPLALPGHVMVCLGDPLDRHVVVDPFHGGVVADAPAEPMLHPIDLLARVLANIRALAARQPRSMDGARTQLWATELSLLLPRHPVQLRKERGELLVRLGDFVGGARELEDYAAVTDDEGALAHARQARARLN